MFAPWKGELDNLFALAAFQELLAAPSGASLVGTLYSGDLCMNLGTVALEQGHCAEADDLLMHGLRLAGRYGEQVRGLDVRVGAGNGSWR